MAAHQCLICIGTNTDREAHLSEARQSLQALFPDIRFGEVMETAAIGTGFRSPFSNQLARFATPLSAAKTSSLLKEVEHRCGRRPDDKAQGIVKLDIDLLMFDDSVLKPEDMEREYVRSALLRTK